jgi:hypothetical protein
MRALFCLFVSAILSSCQIQAPNASKLSAEEVQTPPSGSEKPAIISSIRKVDFRNFTYPWTKAYGFGEKTFTLREGEKSLPDERKLLIESVSYNDLADDFESEEAIIIIRVEDGNATSEMLFVFAMEDYSKVLSLETAKTYIWRPLLWRTANL